MSSHGPIWKQPPIASQTCKTSIEQKPSTQQAPNRSNKHGFGSQTVPSPWYVPPWASQVSEATKLQKEPKQQAPWHAQACNDLAWVLADAREKLDEALTLAQRSARLAPEPNAFDTLGWVHMARGEAELAVVAFEKSLVGRRDPGVLYRSGLAREAAGDAQLAA